MINKRKKRDLKEDFTSPFIIWWNNDNIYIIYHYFYFWIGCVEEVKKSKQIFINFSNSNLFK
jgi:hypothetical protein